jgi:hypothetical protein
MSRTPGTHLRSRTEHSRAPRAAGRSVLRKHGLGDKWLSANLHPGECARRPASGKTRIVDEAADPLFGNLQEGRAARIVTALSGHSGRSRVLQPSPSGHLSRRHLQPHTPGARGGKGTQPLPLQREPA